MPGPLRDSMLPSPRQQPVTHGHPLCSLLVARSPPIPSEQPAASATHARRLLKRAERPRCLPSLIVRNPGGEGIVPFRDLWTRSQQSQKQQSYYVPTGSL